MHASPTRCPALARKLQKLLMFPPAMMVCSCAASVEDQWGPGLFGLSTSALSRWATGLVGHCSGDGGSSGEACATSDVLPSELYACHVLSLARGLGDRYGSLTRDVDGVLDSEPLGAECSCTSVPCFPATPTCTRMQSTSRQSQWCLLLRPGLIRGLPLRVGPSGSAACRLPASRPTAGPLGPPVTPGASPGAPAAERYGRGHAGGAAGPPVARGVVRCAPVAAPWPPAGPAANGRSVRLRGVPPASLPSR